ncbi:MAG TPA: hypothetical protein VGV40_09450 [Solirubrobacteraceae bacterium]|nr:hypothetical protein [Solirubrobacteraceae bacterium]
MAVGVRRGVLGERAGRLRWRLRGAWMWPVFGLLTPAEAVLLHHLPLSGRGTPYVAGFLLAGFFNLLAVAVAAPLMALAVRRRRPDLPRVVAVDYTGTALLGVVGLALVGAGLAHRPARLAAENAMVVQAEAARAYVAAQAPGEYRQRVHEMTSLQVEESLFRSCVPGEDPDRWLCVFVDTASTPPGVTRDRGQESNATFNRPGGFELSRPGAVGPPPGMSAR